VDGQPAHTREVKLGCVFTQTTTDPEGRPVRDEDSTSYVAAIETAEAFGLRLYTEAWRRGWSRAQRKVVIGDGAIWIWNLADQHFPSATQIVDLYHARQHLWELLPKLFPDDHKGSKRWIARCLDRLNRGKIEALVKILRDSQLGHDELAKTIANEAEYFESTRSGCAIRVSAHKVCLLALVSSKPVVGSSSALASNAPECFGPFAVPTPSPHYAVVD
jgi:hypothetical protein